MSGAVPPNVPADPRADAAPRPPPPAAGRLRVVVAMSGGVDSSVAAALLAEAGHEVIGLFMSLGGAAEGGRSERSCCSAADARDAARVAQALGIPFYSLDFGAEFRGIVDYFADEYERGRTPNPCVVCNRDLKFGRLLEFAARVGASHVATGHYARTARDGASGSTRLLRGADRVKDQSYYLFALDAPRLERALFPVGGMTKAEVRRHAARRELATQDKPESMDVCFVPDDYRALLRRLRPGGARPGRFVNRAGETLGRHEGVREFTIGQRRGLGVALGERAYVVGIRPETAEVVLGSAEELERREISVNGVRFCSGAPPADEFRADVQIRYHHLAAPARVTLGPTGAAQVLFDVPQRAVAPGQAAVFYRGDEVLGGGWIE
ncbi:MAG: tRNA 2-thiouridine(34) synthase MnmA [Planctomycetes bacterium]|nr:tRNA 2-thiouridine(34) synthase MnmA [Planctomycetota bacterium]